MDLTQLVLTFSPKADENLLVGMNTSDDAGVYRLSPQTALIHSADIISPVTSDPFVFGQIAAANALSDVYAMGGQPLTALNLCFFPADELSMISMGAILQGGLAKTEEAGALLVGGHTVKDRDLKYGLSVTGRIHPDRVIRNTAARRNDKIILTKPIGTGVHITAYRQGILEDEKLRPVIASMIELNKIAAETAVEFELRGGTDITGFGLAGHALEVAKGSGLGIRIYLETVPQFPSTLELITKGVRTSLTSANSQFVEEHVRFEGPISDAERELFYDPQTSGGLLIMSDKYKVDALVQRLHERGVTGARIIGECFSSESPCLQIVR